MNTQEHLIYLQTFWAYNITYQVILINLWQKTANKVEIELNKKR